MRKIYFLLLAALVFSSCAYQSSVPKALIKRPTYIYPEKYFEYRGTRICYVDAGKQDAQPIIFLHGVLGDIHTWRKTMKALEKDYRVIAIDLPGYGKSDKGAQIPMSISYYTEMTRHFVEFKRLEKPVIVGVSLSGHIVLYYALNFPHEISKAVVVGAVGVDREMRWYEQIEYAALWNDFIIKGFLPSKRFKKIWEKQFSCTRVYNKEFETMPIFHDSVEHDLFITSFNHSISGIFFTNLKDQVKDIQVPLLILWGGFDLHHGIQDAYYLHDQVKGSKLAISPECGHLLMLDDPRFLNKSLINFLKTGDPGARPVSLEEIQVLARAKGVKLKGSGGVGHNYVNAEKD